MDTVFRIFRFQQIWLYHMTGTQGDSQCFTAQIIDTQKFFFGMPLFVIKRPFCTIQKQNIWFMGNKFC